MTYSLNMVHQDELKTVIDLAYEPCNKTSRISYLLEAQELLNKLIEQARFERQINEKTVKYKPYGGETYLQKVL